MDDFDSLWAIYPRKIAKGDARKAWMQTAKIRPPLARLLKAIAVAKASEQWRKDSGQFVPYMSTWLRGERWEDAHEVEIQQVGDDGRMWWETVSGVERKAKELGHEWDARNETFMMFVERMKRLAKVVPIQQAKEIAA